MNWNKLAPIVLTLTALVGLWLSYKTYEKIGGKKCTCDENSGATPIV